MTLEEAYNNLIEYYDGEDDSHEYIQESWAVFKQLQNTSSNKKYTAPQAMPKSCPDCWGSGWLQQFVQPCPTCNGTGRA